MDLKTENFMMRLSSREKEGFKLAASLSGISLASWMRERLRRAAIRELEDHGNAYSFVDSPVDVEESIPESIVSEKLPAVKNKRGMPENLSISDRLRWLRENPNS
jgi:hypothetical protein